MNRFTALVFIGLLAFILVLLLTNPDLFNDIYLYLIGLAGVIMKVLQGFVESIKKALTGDNDESQEVADSASQPKQKTSKQQQASDFYQSDAVG